MDFLMIVMFSTIVSMFPIALYIGKTYESTVIKTEYVRAHIVGMNPPKHVYAICVDDDNGLKFEVSLGKWCSGWDTIPMGSSFTVKRELHKYIRRDEPDFFIYDGEAQVKRFIK